MKCARKTQVHARTARKMQENAVHAANAQQTQQAHGKRTTNAHKISTMVHGISPSPAHKRKSKGIRSMKQVKCLYTHELIKILAAKRLNLQD